MATARNSSLPWGDTVSRSALLVMMPLLAKASQIGLLTGKVGHRVNTEQFADRQPVHAADAHDLFNHTGAISSSRLSLMPRTVASCPEDTRSR